MYSEKVCTLDEKIKKVATTFDNKNHDYGVANFKFLILKSVILKTRTGLGTCFKNIIL